MNNTDSISQSKSVLARRCFAAVFWVIVLAQCLLDREAFGTGNEYFMGVSTLIAVAVIFLWFHFDAESRGFPVSGSLRALVILLAVLGIPIYLVQSRGWNGAVVSLVRFAAILAVTLGAAIGVEMVLGRNPGP